MDGNVYTSRCHANSYHVAVNYMGVCRGSSTEHCKGVVCPELPNESCNGHGVVPPGACCPICGKWIGAYTNNTTIKSILTYARVKCLPCQQVVQLRY